MKKLSVSPYREPGGEIGGKEGGVKTANVRGEPDIFYFKFHRS